MSASESQPPAPPRLLLGAALLFWGGATDHQLAGLACAFLVEARSWTDLRWSFGERGFVRAWVLSIVLATLLLAWVWLQGERAPILFELLEWMPVYLLPVLLAQLYATQPSMPLNTFSLIARRKMLIDRAAGRRVDPIQIHVGYPYLCLVLVASALGGVPGWLFFLGLCTLMAAALFFVSPYGRTRPYSWTAAILMVGVLGGGGALGLNALYNYLGGVFSTPAGIQTSTDRARTAIGQLGRIKQTYRILWRVQDREPAGKTLFREAVYNRYAAGQWSHRPMVGSLLKEDFDDMEIRNQTGGENEFAFKTGEFDRDPAMLRKLVVKGRVHTRLPTPLPLPDTTQRLSRLKSEFVEYNSLGSVRIVNPEQSVIAFDIYYGRAGLYEKAPDPKLDLQIPKPERPGIARVCDQWGLRSLPTGLEVSQIIKRRFVEDFHYTMHLRQYHDTGPGYREAISEFLEGDPERGGKTGHCEYFATAAVLLLREAGVPARYCVGFAAREKNEATSEWLLRGRHAHAWCRVWNGERWVDFDPTPPDWFALEGSGIKWYQKLLDWWQRVREDFLLWRTTAGNSGVVNWVMGILGTLVLVYVAIRLWQSRIRRQARRRGRRTRNQGAVMTPLHGLARPAARWLASRPDGQSYTEWILGLGEHIPAARPALERAISYHWKARFDPIGLDAGESGEFEQLCRELRRRLKEHRRLGG